MDGLERAEHLERQARVLDWRYKVALLVISSATIVAIVVAALQENYFADWHRYRRQYEDVLKEKATDDVGRATAEQFSGGMVQNFVPALGAVDRCMTCHAGVEDPRMVAAEQPFTKHPGRYLELHDPEKFGCTVCHMGQGRASTTDDAHGHVPHWDWPMLAKGYVTTSCTKCHKGDLLSGDGGFIQRAAGDEGSASLAVGGLFSEGRRLTTERGCLGCHVMDGKGGTLGPDLTLEAEKTRHDFDFSHVHGHGSARNVSDWLKEHFLAPAEVSPGSVMPPIEDEAEADALTAYMLSRHEKIGSGVYRREDSDAKHGGDDGAVLYARYCSACHGAEGRGSQVGDITTPSLNNPDVLAVADDDYMRAIIAEGRSGSDMPAWKEGAGNLTRDEIDRIVEHVRGWEPRGANPALVGREHGDAKQGASYYRALCAGCHGANGEGGIGNALKAESFLAIADDRLLARSIIDGRPGTAMPSWRHLSEQTVSDLIAFIRTWQPTAPSFAEVGQAMALVDSTENARLGKGLYASRCAGCHGEDGKGSIGPSIVSPDFLRAVDNRYLYRAIVEGRPTTAMPTWSHLSADDVGALIAYLRSYQTETSLELGGALPRGDEGVGRVLYEQTCASCHGPGGSGATGPQLANRVFLDSASDAVLRYWILNGRVGTAMMGFGRNAEGPVTLRDDDVADIIAYLRKISKDGAMPEPRLGIGRSDVGEQIYADSCASCHGPKGEGASGPQLANPYFLDTVSDGFLAATIALGRTGTAMLPMVHGFEGLGQIEPESVQDLVAFMRTWETPRTWRATRRVPDISENAVSEGRQAYAVYCAGCHGKNGLGSEEPDGSFAPALNNPEFLRAASDGFLLATIARGRQGTAMRAFGRGAGGIVEIDSDTISNIVSFIRSWQPEGTEAATGGSNHEEG